jgi:hypothetical protein
VPQLPFDVLKAPAAEMSGGTRRCGPASPSRLALTLFIDWSKNRTSAPPPAPSAGSVMMIGTGRKPLRSSSHSLRSIRPSPGSTIEEGMKSACAQGQAAATAIAIAKRIAFIGRCRCVLS